MRKKRPLISAAIVVAAIAIAGTAWWFMRPAQIPVFEVRRTNIEILLSVVGRVRPETLIDVRSPNPGQVISLLHEEGDLVEANAPLAIVRSAIEQAQTEAERARERAASAEVRRAQLAFDRTNTLSDRGFATKAALDEARAALQSAKASLEAAAASRRAAAARTGEFTIRAPVAGVVLLRPIDNGQVVSPDTTLFQLGSRTGVELRAEADEAYADVLKQDMPARAALTGSDDIFAARITEVSPRVDPITGGRAIRLVPVDGRQLPPGRSVDITIIVAERKAGMVVPRQAVLSATAAPKVYIVDTNGIVQERTIQIADWPSLNAIVESGLSEGDQVILTPEATRPSAKIRPQLQPGTAP